jgi:hypothetical protein
MSLRTRPKRQLCTPANIQAAVHLTLGRQLPPQSAAIAQFLGPPLTSGDTLGHICVLSVACLPLRAWVHIRVSIPGAVVVRRQAGLPPASP